jgi:hypothetical protein
MIKIIESTIKLKLAKKYITLYAEVRSADYPIEHGFLVTKIKFQEYIIDEMFSNPTQAREIISAYSSIKTDKKIQEKALAYYEEVAKYESFLDSVKPS